MKWDFSGSLSCVVLAAAACLLATTLQAQEQKQIGPSSVITTVAGDGFMGDVGNGGSATRAQFIYPISAAVDADGNIYISDQEAQVIRKVDAVTGKIHLFAGTGRGGYSGDGGQAKTAELNEPHGLAFDLLGNLYFADSKNNVIRKVDTKTGIITTVAGNGFGAGGGEIDDCGSFAFTSLPTPATQTNLCEPSGIAVDTHNNVYFADLFNVVRLLNTTTEELTIVAGSGATGYSGDGNTPTSASFSFLEAVAVDGAGNLYIADTGNCAVREVPASTGLIKSLVGVPAPGGYGGTCGLSGDGGPASIAKISEPWGLAVDQAGNVFISDSDNALIRFVSAADGNIYTAAGSYNTYGSFSSGIYGYTGDGGPATKAELEFPTGLSFDSSGSLYAADTSNFAIRKITSPAVPPTDVPVVQVTESQSETPTEVTITPPVPGAKVYYSTNETLPTIHSTVYTGPFTLHKSAVITAFATVEGVPNSGIEDASFLYTPAPKIVPGTGKITPETKVVISDANPVGTLYYSTNGVVSTSSKVYKGPLNFSAGTTLTAALFTSVHDTTGKVISVMGPTTTVTYTLAAPKDADINQGTTDPQAEQP